MRNSLIVFIHALIITPVLIGSYKSSWWALDLFSNFINFYIYLVALLILLSLIIKNIYLIFINCILLLVLSINFTYIEADTDLSNYSTPRTVRIFSLNVNMDNADYSIVENAVIHYKPDILVLLEYNKAWHYGLQRITSSYAYHHSIIRDDYFGIAIYSKYEIKEPLTEYHAGIDIPSVTAQILADKKIFKLRAVHLDWPIFKKNAEKRNSQLLKLAKSISEDKVASITIGDFNLTPWSYYFSKFLQQSKTKSCTGTSLKGTWPGLSRYIAIPIDHCFFSNKVRIKNFNTPDNTSSDHFPIIVDFIIE